MREHQGSVFWKLFLLKKIDFLEKSKNKTANVKFKI